mgnify:FL=1
MNKSLIDQFFDIATGLCESCSVNDYSCSICTCVGAETNIDLKKSIFKVETCSEYKRRSETGRKN